MFISIEKVVVVYSCEVLLMLASGPVKSPKVIIEFLKDPKVSPDIKQVCIRLLRNPFLSQLFEKTTFEVIFEICNEYKKHPDIYDDIFSGKIKMRLTSMDTALPIIDCKEIEKDCSIKSLFEPNTLIGQIVEKFAVSKTEYSQIKKIAVKIKENKMMTATFNSENRIVSMLVDFVSPKNKGNAIVNFLRTRNHKRVDLIRF